MSYLQSLLAAILKGQWGKVGREKAEDTRSFIFIYIFIFHIYICLKNTHDFTKNRQMVKSIIVNLLVITRKA